MTGDQLAMHETLEVHELLAFKNVCMTKSQSMQGLASDQQLNSLIQTCVETDRQHIEDLKGLLSGGTTTTAQ